MRNRLSALLAASALLLAGCSDGGTNPPPPPPPPPPTITVAIAGPVSVMQGQSATTNITITRGGGYNGAVSLAASGLPTGVTAAFDPASIPAGSGGSVLTLIASSTATAGVGQFTVTASGTGVSNATANGNVAVTEAPDFTLAASPATLSIQQGASGTETITIVRRGGHTEGIFLTVSGLPTGVTSDLDDDFQFGNEVVFTLLVGTTAQVGSSTITVSAGQGQGQRTATFRLTVTPPVPGGNVSFKFCDLDDLPLFFAYYDNDWAAVTGTNVADGRVYSFGLNTTEGAVAWVTGSNTAEGYTTTVINATREELIGLGNGQCAASPNTSRTLNGSVAGLAAGESAAIGMGTATTGILGPTATFQLKDAPNFPADLIATRSTAQLGGSLPGFYPAKVIVRRNVEYQDGATIPLLDFANDGFVPQSAQLTVGNLLGGNVSTSMSYRTPTTTASLGLTISASVGTMTIFGVAAANQAATDLHQLSMLSSGSGQSRGRMVWFKAIGDRTENLGPALNDPAITTGAGGYPRYFASGAVQAEYDEVFTFSISQQIAVPRTFTVLGTRASQLGANYFLGFPDLTGAGYQTVWALQSGAGQGVWNVFGFGYSGGGYQLPIVDGGVSQFASKAGQVTP